MLSPSSLSSALSYDLAITPNPNHPASPGTFFTHHVPTMRRRTLRSLFGNREHLGQSEEKEKETPYIWHHQPTYIPILMG